MAETTVHLTISGIIALQHVDPAEGLPYKWRVVVPDHSGDQHHPHTAFFLVATADLVPPPQQRDQYTIYHLEGNVGRIDGVTAEGSYDFPDELITMEEACASPAGKCPKIKHGSEFGTTPALVLWIADAGIEATWMDGDTEWYFERPVQGKPPEKKRKKPDGIVAEEVCLTFKVPSNRLRLDLSGGAGNAPSIELEPNSNGVIELRLGNIVPDELGTWRDEDPHFHMYYDMTRASDPARHRAKLKTDASAKGTTVKRHEGLHALSEARIPTVKLRGGTHHHGETSSRVTEDPGPGIRSVTGSNCPPVGGDPYP